MFSGDWVNRAGHAVSSSARTGTNASTQIVLVHRVTVLGIDNFASTLVSHMTCSGPPWLRQRPYPRGRQRRVPTAAPVTAPPVAPTSVPTGWAPDSPVIGSLLRWLLLLMAVFLICNVDRSGEVSIVWLLRRSIQCFVNDYCADHVSFASRVCLLCRKEAIPVVIDSSKTLSSRCCEELYRAAQSECRFVALC